MASLDETPFIELGTKPISDAAPCGDDPADDERYMLVGAETTKIGRVDLGEPDWRQIESAATDVLRAKAKDLEMACALGQALFKRARYAGLAAALALFEKLTVNFWDGMYPARPRRRRARLEGLLEALVEGGALSAAAPRPDEFDFVDRCLDRLETLETALKGKLPEEPPDFNKFRRKLKEHAAGRPKPAGGAAPASGAAPQVGGGTAFAAGDVSDVSGAVSAIHKAATFIRKADATEPLPYAVARILKWSKLQPLRAGAALTPADPPDKQVVEALTFQFSQGLWDLVLENAEGAFRASDPLWLDLQRYVCGAMQNLGAKFDAARRTVQELTAGVVLRLGPAVYELTFRGGQPMCSGETKMWLETDVLPQRGEAGGGNSAGNGRLSEASTEARKLAGSGKITEAVKALREGLQSASEGRERFQWRLQIAELCFETQRLQLATPLLEECHEDVKRYHLDQWEPRLAVRVAQTLYKCRKALAAGQTEPAPEALERLRDSFAWLCQLDPLAALAAEPAGK